MLPEMTIDYKEILDYQKMSFNREVLVKNYAQTVVENMNLDVLIEFACATIVEDLNKLSDEELLREVDAFNPELLAGVETL
jgi:hypothetical protein